MNSESRREVQRNSKFSARCSYAGQSGYTPESLQNRGSPPPAGRAGRDSREVVRGECCVSPEVPRHGDGSSHPSAKRVARLGGAAGGCAPSAALRAARGRGNKPIFAFLHWEYPLPELSVTRLARGKFFGLSPHKHRAPRPRKLPFPDSRGCYPNNFCGTFLARRAQSFSRLPSRARFRENPVLPRPRHKRHTVSATQTIRFNVPASAYNGVFANATNARGNRFLPPRHSLPVGAGRGIPGRGCKFAPANLAPSLRG